MATQRGPYAKTPEVRARIIDAASEMFAASGYRGTTMKDIAATCGLTAKGVAHHFPSKDELLMAVLADRDLRGRRVVEEIPERPASWDVVFESLAAARREPRLVELYAVLSAEAISADHPAHDYYEQRYDYVRSQLEFSIKSLAGEAEESGDLSALDLATLLVAVIDGLQLQWLYNEEAVDLDRLIRAFVQRFTASELAGTTNA